MTGRGGEGTFELALSCSSRSSKYPAFSESCLARSSILVRSAAFSCATTKPYRCMNCITPLASDVAHCTGEGRLVDRSSGRREIYSKYPHCCQTGAQIVIRRCLAGLLSVLSGRTRRPESRQMPRGNMVR